MKERTPTEAEECVYHNHNSWTDGMPWKRYIIIDWVLMNEIIPTYTSNIFQHSEQSKHILSDSSISIKDIKSLLRYETQHAPYRHIGKARYEMNTCMDEDEHD